MRLLTLAGFDVAAGALAEGDTDGAVALALGSRFRHVEQFSPMSDADVSAVVDLAHEADAVLVVATPFGPDNVGNLEAVLTAGVAAKTVLVGSITPEMDFARGEAVASWERLSEGGAAIAADVAAAIAHIDEMGFR
jgi:hypothetical protein